MIAIPANHMKMNYTIIFSHETINQTYPRASTHLLTKANTDRKWQNRCVNGQADWLSIVNFFLIV